VQLYFIFSGPSRCQTAQQPSIKCFDRKRHYSKTHIHLARPSPIFTEGQLTSAKFDLKFRPDLHLSGPRFETKQQSLN